MSENKPAFFLGYRPVPFKNNEFIPNDARKRECREFMEQDLALSGLIMEDIHASPYEYAIDGVDAAYLIPYTDLKGQFIVLEDGYSKMYRLKLKLNERAYDLGKYTGPSAKQVGPELATAPWIPPGGLSGGDVLYICEGEKKAACVRKYLGVDTIGIGGKDNWGRGGQLHSWIEKIRSLYERVVIIPDGDIHRYDIARSYGTLATRLGADTIILDCPDKIDDLIVKWLAEGLDVAECIGEIPVLTERVESAQLLCDTYGLTWEEVKKSRRIEPNESNAIRLLKGHPGFPPIWRNFDDDQVYAGDMSLEQGGAFDVLGMFQHELGITKMRASSVDRAIARLAEERGRSPWLDWLDGLVWDGVERLDGLFVDYCGARDTEFVRTLARRWLVGSVARQYVPGVPVDYMVIAQGAQGIGKSRFLKSLFGREAVVDIIGVETQHKDLLGKMHMGKVVAFEEMAAMNHKDIEHLKALVTSTHDTYRAPYARETKSTARRFVMYASTNRTSFLNHDESGYRRWGVVEFGVVDLEGVERDRAQLWAEAVAGYRGGEEFSWIEVPREVAADFVKESTIVDQWEVAWGRRGEMSKLGGLDAGFKKYDGVYAMTVAEILAVVGVEAGGRGRPPVGTNDLLEHLKATGWRKYETRKFGDLVLKRVYVKEEDVG